MTDHDAEFVPAAGSEVVALRDLAVEVASEAGALLLARLHEPRTAVSTKSTGTDMVTEMDAASEALIVDRIRAARPDDELVGEEGTSVAGTSGVRWVIDPLDGTTNYLYRLPGWNVSIGVEVDGIPIAGAVTIPATGDSFAAAAGHGATHNDTPMVVGAPEPLSTALVGTGFSYDRSVREVQVQRLGAIIGEVRDIRRIGAAAADLCSVAAGRLDAYVESGLAAWDWCAGMVIAREAGVRVETTVDHPLPGTLVIAAHPEAWDDFVGLLGRAGIVSSRPISESRDHRQSEHAHGPPPP